MEACAHRRRLLPARQGATSPDLARSPLGRPPAAAPSFDLPVLSAAGLFALQDRRHRPEHRRARRAQRSGRRDARASRDASGATAASPSPQPALRPLTPARALAAAQEYREKGAKGNVYFGQHLVHEWPPPLLWALGRRLQGRPPTPCLAVGASVEVLERGEPVWDRGPTADE